MEKVIFFPKNEIHFFNEGKRFYQEANYKKAVLLFEKAVKLKYLKSECIKYLIECHIELKNFEEVYKMIEDEFVEQNVDEEYLLKKYLYTMVLDEQLLEASEIIKIYQNNKIISKDLNHYLNELTELIDSKLNGLNKNFPNHLLHYLKSDQFEDHIQIILNLEMLNDMTYEKEIQEFLLNSHVDSFVKYTLLKYLFNNDLMEQVYYMNAFNEKSLIKKADFIEILDADFFQETLEEVKNQLSIYPQVNEIIQNIWLDFNIKHYPNLITDFNQASCILHILLLKSLDFPFNINDVCKRYEVNSKSIFQYFDC